MHSGLKNWKTGTKTRTAITVQKNQSRKPQHFSKTMVWGFLQEFQPKNYKIAQLVKSIQFDPKNLLHECIIYLKILVSLHECAKFGKSWRWKQTFVSTETANWTIILPVRTRFGTGSTYCGFLNTLTLRLYLDW